MVAVEGGPLPKKVWTTIITNTKYLSGLITLDYSLKKVKSAYPLVALFTDTFPIEGQEALKARGIPKKRIDYLLPQTSKEFPDDHRFYDCWSKLTPFGLIEFDRIVQLDSDMLVLQNMDELMDIPLDAPLNGELGYRVFAASHACVCNPLKKAHYPKDWIPENCAFSMQHHNPIEAQTKGMPSYAGLGIPNGGLQVVSPNKEVYDIILTALSNPNITSSCEFADQSLLGHVFHGRWVALPYIYNGLKTLRQKGVHDAIWRDDKVKNVHYILDPKPWDENWNLEGGSMDVPAQYTDDSHLWWVKISQDRKLIEAMNGIHDAF